MIKKLAVLSFLAAVPAASAATIDGGIGPQGFSAPSPACSPIGFNPNRYQAAGPVYCETSGGALTWGKPVRFPIDSAYPASSLMFSGQSFSGVDFDEVFVGGTLSFGNSETLPGSDISTAVLTVGGVASVNGGDFDPLPPLTLDISIASNAIWFTNYPGFGMFVVPENATTSISTFPIGNVELLFSINSLHFEGFGTANGGTVQSLVNNVPEPGTLTALLPILGMLGAARWRRGRPLSA